MSEGYPDPTPNETGPFGRLDNLVRRNTPTLRDIFSAAAAVPTALTTDTSGVNLSPVALPRPNPGFLTIDPQRQASEIAASDARYAALPATQEWPITTLPQSEPAMIPAATEQGVHSRPSQFVPTPSGPLGDNISRSGGNYTLTPHVGPEFSYEGGVAPRQVQFGGGTASVDRSKGLSGQAWIDSAKADPEHGFHSASLGVWQDPNTQRPVAEGSPEFSPVPNGYDPATLAKLGGAPGHEHEGFLFSGAGTQAEMEGTLQRAVHGAQLAEARSLEADPYGRERLKSQASLGPAYIAANSADNVARQRTAADVAVQGERSRSAKAVERLRGRTAATKEEAQYASFDKLLNEQLQITVNRWVTNAEATGQDRQPGYEDAKNAFVLEQALKKNQARIEARKMGIAGRDPYAFLTAMQQQAADPHDIEK